MQAECQRQPHRNARIPVHATPCSEADRSIPAPRLPTPARPPSAARVNPRCSPGAEPARLQAHGRAGLDDAAVVGAHVVDAAREAAGDGDVEGARSARRRCGGSASREAGRRGPSAAEGAPRRPDRASTRASSVSSRCTVLGPWWQQRPHATQSAPPGSGSPSTRREAATISVAPRGQLAAARARAAIWRELLRAGAPPSGARRDRGASVEKRSSHQQGRAPGACVSALQRRGQAVVGDVHGDLRHLRVRVEEHAPGQRLEGDAAEGVDVGLGRRRLDQPLERAPHLRRAVGARRAPRADVLARQPEVDEDAPARPPRMTTFDGLMSRCATPAACIASSPASTSSSTRERARGVERRRPRAGARASRPRRAPSRGWAWACSPRRT